MEPYFGWAGPENDSSQLTAGAAHPFTHRVQLTLECLLLDSFIEWLKGKVQVKKKTKQYLIKFTTK